MKRYIKSSSKIVRYPNGKVIDIYSPHQVI